MTSYNILGVTGIYFIADERGSIPIRAPLLNAAAANQGSYEQPRILEAKVGLHALAPARQLVVVLPLEILQTNPGEDK